MCARRRLALHAGLQIALQERNFRILDALIDLTQQMVEGELLQMEKLGKLITLDEHFDLIYRKTACLFSVSCAWAQSSAVPSEQEDQVARYGRDLGWPSKSLTTSSTLPPLKSVFGKPVASDLREGKSPGRNSRPRAAARPTNAPDPTVVGQRAFNGVTHAHILKSSTPTVPSMPPSPSPAGTPIPPESLYTLPDSEIQARPPLDPRIRRRPRKISKVITRSPPTLSS